MANKDDYLTDYRRFFENFAQTVNPNDQLPVKLGSYKLVNVEVVGGIIDWTTQYLSQKRCPQSLIAPLIKIVIDEVRKLCKKQPVACGFNVSDNAYEPLRLMQTVMAKTNEICLRYLDNSKLCSLPTPGPPYNTTTACAVKNNRRRMEDRHVIIHDLNSLFIEQEASPSSYYAIFDGHAGHDAAAYSCAHLHQFLGESKDFISNPEQALRDAFLKTDALFLDKCKVENFSSGTTAVCALLRHKEKTLYIAWVGDSQALLVSQGRLVQCVQPHKPSREDEKNRIEREGGVVIYWGTWRVNGQLAVSRAIGDLEYKPYVTAVPDVVEIPLTGAEDFLILACDGLWDFISEDDAARCVYSVISQNPDDIDSISQHLVQLAKQQGSSDNISVIVVFLRETSKVAAEAHWATRNGLIMDTLDNANTTTNPFANSNNPDILAQKEGFVLNLADGFKHNGTEKSPAGDFLGRPTNGKRSADEFDDDDDLGPETDVDAVDDVLLSPAIAAAKSLAEGFVNNNPAAMFDPFGDKEEKATLETDSELQKQQTSEFDPVKSPREETPTPPADSVHDASGLVDNVAESGEDSDDEWNYFKGDTAQKENIPPSQTDKEVCELTQSSLDSDTMSQLNPNAAEFVPVSPKRNTASPAYQALIDDSVIAQSPRRIVANNDIDISVPNPQEFESEIKSRPSDIRECANGDDENKLSSQEIMENLLNGKSMDEIEFQPNSTPTKVHKGDEFHFGPNATPFSTPAKLLDQSEALSTKAVFGDESTASYLDGKGFDDSFTGNDVNESQAFSKEQDPMSMSFYQDKDDDTNPFDLNKVQVLPEDIDDFLEKPNESAPLLNDTISDLPEHNPSDFEKGNEINPAAGDNIGISVAEPMEREVVSPLGDHIPVAAAQSPLPVSHSPLPGTQSPLSGVQSPLSGHHTPLSPTQSPLPMAHSPLPMAESPLPAMESPQPGPQSPLPTADSPLPTAQSPVPQSLLSQSPLPPSKSPLLQSQSPLPVSECILPTTQSPLAASPSPVPPTQSPLPTSPSPIPPSRSPLPPSQSPLLPSQSPLPPSRSPLPTSQSPLPTSPSPIPPSRSPLPTLQSPVPPAQSPVATAQSPFLCESPIPSPLPLAHSPVPPQSPLRELESPVEDITSSVKDSPILAASPIENKAVDEPNVFADNYAQQISDAIQETVTAEVVSPVNNLDKDVLIPETCPVSTPKSVESEHVDTDSVTTTDVNSFLERSLLPDVASPLSPSGDENKLIDAFTSELEANKLEDAGFTVPSSLTIMAQDILIPSGPHTQAGSIDVDIKSEIIAPEYPVQTITTPSEESKTEDITQNEAVVAPVAPQETKENVPEVAAVAATAAAVAAAAVAEKKTTIPKSKTGAAPAAKKQLKPATSPTKPTAAKPSPRLSTTTRTSTTASSKVTQARTPTTTPTASPKPAAKPLPKPKTAPTTKALDKKPLTNGDVKPPAIKRAPLGAATRTTTTKPVPSKLSPTKTSVDGKATTGTARPTAAPLKSTTMRQTATSARPSNLVKTSSVTSSTRTTSSTVTATKNQSVFERLASPVVRSPPRSTVRSTTLSSPKAPTSAAAKPRPATAPARPKPLASRPAPKAADTEKQAKETANKQITASRTSTMTRTAGSAGKTTTTTVRKTEVKAPGARMTVTKTTTSTMRPTDVKKPAELIRHPPGKTKVGVKKAKTEQNGIPVEVNTITISPTNIEPQLIKDVSPVVETLVFDNAQITEINNVTD